MKDLVRETKRYGEFVFEPQVSVVTVNLNGKDVLPTFLDSLAASLHPSFELVIVDNGSTDGGLESLDLKKLEKTNALLVRLDRNTGFAEGNNIGVALSRGEYIVLLNNDTRIEPDCLSKMVEPLRDNSVGAVQARLLSWDGKLVDGEGDFIDIFGVPFIFAHGENALRRQPLRREIFSARAAAMAVRRELFIRMGGFDTRFVYGFEDVDLGWRMRLKGYKVVLIPEAIVYHLGSFTLGKMSWRKSIAQRNLVYLVAKDVRSSILVLSLMISVVQYFLSSFSYALSGGGVESLFSRQISDVLAFVGYGIKNRSTAFNPSTSKNVYRGDLVYRGSASIHYTAARLLWLLKYKRLGVPYEEYKNIALRWISQKFRESCV